MANSNNRVYHNPGTKASVTLAAVENKAAVKSSTFPNSKAADQRGGVAVHAHWIHETKEDLSSVTGYFVLPACRCSNCGTKQNTERSWCPKCKAVMDEESVVEINSVSAVADSKPASTLASSSASSSASTPAGAE